MAVESTPHPTDYDDPFAFALDLGSSAGAMSQVWNLWRNMSARLVEAEALLLRARIAANTQYKDKPLVEMIDIFLGTPDVL